MSISIYLILLVVLLIFNLLFWLLVIWFRILFNCDFGLCCCSDVESVDNASQASGHRNLGYIDDDPANTPEMPFTVTEALESPPSYEEAMKHDRFGYEVTNLPTVHTTPSSSSSTPFPSSSEEPSHNQSSQSPTVVKQLQSQLSQSPPRTLDIRPRSSTSSSVCPLTPIREEDTDDTSISVVIDSIGRQASRIVPNCETRVNITDGEQLNGYSKC